MKIGDKMNLKKFTVGNVMSQCYIISKNKKAIIIDPGAEGERIYNYLLDNNLELKFIINTHGHFDHIAANDFLKNKTGADILAHPRADLKFKDPVANLSQPFLRKEIIAPPLDKPINDGDKIEFEDLELKILYTPGHSDDSISIYLESEKILFPGDCIFASGYGRTDLKDSSFSQLKKSISGKILTLPEDIEYYAGHGPKSTIKKFKAAIWPYMN